MELLISKSQDFPSRFSLGDLVGFHIADIVLKSKILAITFMPGKVCYTLAVFTNGMEPSVKDQYGLINSIGWAEKGEEYVRVPNVDSTFVEPYEERS